MLKDPGFKLNFSLPILNSRSGKTTCQPNPIGHATNCITRDVMIIDGARIENNMFRAEPTVVRINPIVQARIVLAGTSSSY